MAKQQAVTLTWYVSVPDDGGADYAGVSSAGDVVELLSEHPEVVYVQTGGATFGEVEEVDE